MKVRYYEGLASHIALESCACHREVSGEGLTEERAGQPLSRDRKLVSGADAVCVAEGKTSECATASTQPTRRGRRTWHVRTLLVREPGDLESDQLSYRAGPHREGEEP